METASHVRYGGKDVATITATPNALWQATEQVDRTVECDLFSNLKELTMATGGDEISILANELEKVSLPKPLYQEQSIAGKGVGCIASTDIRKGKLVLREFPALLTSNWKRDLTDQDVHRSTEDIIRAFLDMSEEEQEIYMKLYNCYDKPTWSNTMKKHLESDT